MYLCESLVAELSLRNYIVVRLMKDWLCSSTHYLQSAVSLPMQLWLERPNWSNRPRLIQTILCVFTSEVVMAALKYLRDRRVSKKPDIYTWLFYFIIALRFLTLNKVTEINKVMQCNCCFLGFQKFYWQKIIFTLFLNV